MEKTEHNPAPRVLLADDQLSMLKALRLLLKGEGYEIETVASSAAIVEAIGRQDFDVVLMDLNYVRGSTSGQEGLDLLSNIQQIDSTLPVVVMTAWGTVELAVEAMRRGARDFLTKPWKNERLLAILRTQVELGRALRKGRRLEQENLLLRSEDRPFFIAQSRAMQPVLDTIARVGPSQANVLITGENGAGKGIVAQALHGASTRKDKPLVSVNTASIPGTLFESELFGHVAGAFTDARSDRIGRFKLADGGTLFLDEIASIPANLQSKLLRVLESGEFEPVGSSKTHRVDVRILSATNANLAEEIAASRFRQDLLYRLKTVEIRIPPLRERREDIPLLATHFLQRYVGRYRKSLTGFDAASLQVLMAYSWPGNVRELDHTVERAVLMSRGGSVQASDLGIEPRRESGPTIDNMTIEQVEQMMIRSALSRFQGDISKAAEALGLSRAALYRRLDKHGIE
jgi:DNA-binding NtrC family response regulator